MTPLRKRIATLIVVVGSALIGERVYSLALAEPVAGEVVAPRRSAKATSSDRADNRADGGAFEAKGAAPGVLHTERLEARQMALSESVEPGPRTHQSEPFERVDWQPAPAKPAAPAPAPKPAAPTFAYTYMGGLTEDGVRTSFFTQGDKIIAVKVGDTVDAAYRIDQMTDQQMKLTYLPLNETLVLALGSRP